MGEAHADEGLRNRLIQCAASVDAQAIDPPSKRFRARVIRFGKDRSAENPCDTGRISTTGFVGPKVTMEIPGRGSASLSAREFSYCGCA
jgi:hypothetical protein